MTTLPLPPRARARSGSDTVHRPHGWRRSSRLPLLVAVVLVALAELVVRLAELPAPLRWSSGEAQVKAAELEALGRRGGVDTVVVGSSIADVAFDADRLARPPEIGNAYNAALLGIDLRSLELWLSQVVLPSASPDRLVMGLSCRDLNGAEAAQDEYFRSFVRAPAMRERMGSERWLDRLDRWVGDRVSLVRYRSVLRVPRSIGGINRRTDLNLDLGTSGYNRAYRNRSYPSPDRVREVLFPGAISRFGVGDELVAALDRTLANLKGSGVEAVVVHMPVTSDWLDYLPSREAFDRCNTVLADRAARGGATFVDGGVLPTSLFADPIHVNGAGADHITDRLAAVLSGTT